MTAETMTLKPVGPLRWHVYKPAEDVTEAERKKAAKSWEGYDPRFIGQIQKQEFTSYPRGKPVKRALWFPCTKGGVSAGKPQKTRIEALRILCA